MFALGESIGGVTGLIFAGNESAVRIPPSNRSLKSLGADGSILFCATFIGAAPSDATGGSARAVVAAIDSANAGIITNLSNGLSFGTPVPAGKTRPLRQGSLRDCRADASLATIKPLAPASTFFCGAG
jgi:hypothetical protein